MQGEKVTVTHLELGIGPAGNLNNHVEDSLLLVGIERDIVEGRDGDAILLDVDAVLQSVGRRLLADLVLGSHAGRRCVVAGCVGARHGRSGEVPGDLCCAPS